MRSGILLIQSLRKLLHNPPAMTSSKQAISTFQIYFLSEHILTVLSESHHDLDYHYLPH